MTIFENTNGPMKKYIAAKTLKPQMALHCLKKKQTVRVQRKCHQRRILKKTEPAKDGIAQKTKFVEVHYIVTVIQEVELHSFEVEGDGSNIYSQKEEIIETNMSPAI